MKLKMMEYNIKNGFFDKDNEGDFKLNKERQRAGQEIVQKVNPDILTICEADFINKEDNPQDYKQIFNYPHGFFITSPLEKRGLGIGVLSKYPIVYSKGYTPKNSRWVKTKIKIKDKGIQVNAVHPTPLNTLPEKLALFKRILKHKDKRFILSGDFNSLSPQDSIDEEDLLKSFTGKFDNEMKAKKAVDELLKKETIKLILSNNLIDTFKEENEEWDYSYHTNLSGNSYARYDYIFCSRDFEVIDSRIIKNELAEKASDHYPIYATLNI